MAKKIGRSSIAIAFVTGLAVIGCGGGGGGGTTTGTTSGETSGGGSTVPTAKTKSDVASNISAYHASIVSGSFPAFGPKLRAPGGEFFDIALGLWATVRVSPSGVLESLYVEENKSTTAGVLSYTINEAAKTITGPITVTMGPYTGLTGQYFQAIQPDGFNGSINYSLADGTTVVSSYAEQNDDNGNIFGTATIGVALVSGYNQTQQAAFVADGTQQATSTDSNGCRSSVRFLNNLSFTGQVTGSDPGLPATIACNSQGTGVVTYANGSTSTVTSWLLVN